MISVIGRRTGAVKDVVQTEDVVIQFSNDTTVRISSEEIKGRGYVFTITWDAPKSIRLEDCVNLGKSNNYLLHRAETRGALRDF